jgi:O-antigen ligase
MNVGFGILLVFFIAKRLRPGRGASSGIFEIPGAGSLATVSGILAAACILSLWVMHVWPHSYAGHSPVLTFRAFEKLWYLLIPFIFVSAFRTHAAHSLPALNFLRRVWWGTLLALMPIAIIQFLTGWPKPQVIPTNPDRFHAILFLGHHLSVSSVIPFPTFTALAVCLGAWQRDRKLPWFPAVVGISGLSILFLSYARTAWLAIPIGLILLFVRYLKPRVLVASLIGLILTLTLASQTPAMKERIRNSMGIQDRFLLWEANLDYFKHRPLTGIGWLATQEMSQYYFQEKDPEHYQKYFWGHAHSNYFEMLGGAGLIGLLAFLIYVFYTVKFSWETGRWADASGLPGWGDFSRGLTVALILLHFNGLTNVTFWEGKVIHQQMLALGLLLAIRSFLHSSGAGR